MRNTKYKNIMFNIYDFLHVFHSLNALFGQNRSEIVFKTFLSNKNDEVVLAGVNTKHGDRIRDRVNAAFCWAFRFVDSKRRFL